MSEDQARQLMQQMRELEVYFGDLAEREAAISNVLKEATAAVTSIKSLSEKPESEALVPIGMGAYLPTMVSSGKKIILNIGAGVSVEKDYASAVNYLEARIKEVEVALQDTAAKKQQAAAQLEQGRAQVSQMMQSLQPQGQG